MKRGVWIVLVLSVVVAMSPVSAGMYFSEVDSVYNLGDMVELIVEVDPILEGHLVRVDLICQGDEVITFNHLPDASGFVDVRLPLNSNTIDAASGSCYFRGKYGSEKRDSNSFEISRRLEVGLVSDSFFVKPGESIRIEGTVTRLNGAPITGEVEITIPLLQLFSGVQDVVEEDSEEDEERNETNDEEGAVVEEHIEVVDTGVFYGKVADGSFSVAIPFAEDIPAGEYRVDVLAYESLGGERTSEGLSMATLTVFQILTSVDIALNDLNLDPGSELVFKPLLLDQTGLPIDDEVSVIIRDEQGIRIHEQLAQSDQSFTYLLPSNITAGYYEIDVSLDEHRARKQLYVNEKAIASFELLNTTLIVTNIGNIRYARDIQIDINGKPFLKKVDLALGERKEFRLTGTGGEYSIRIGDGEKEIIQEGVALTGRVVGVSEPGKGISLGPFFWIFFVVLALGIVLFGFRSRVFKRNVFTYPFAHTRNDITIGRSSGAKPVHTSAHHPPSPSTPSTHAQPVGHRRISAVQTLVSNGEKNVVSIVAIAIKNKIHTVSKHALAHAIEPAYAHKGAVYEQGDYLFIFFSPTLTGSKENEGTAANVARKIVVGLNAYNTHFKEKIEFGIAIHSGNVIDQAVRGQLHFTTIGSILISAKRLAGLSSGTVFLSKDAYTRGSATINAIKKTTQGATVYEVKSIVDHTQNEAFVKKFLSRMDQK